MKGRYRMKTIKDYKVSSDQDVIIVVEVDNIKKTPYDSSRKEIYEGELGKCPSKFDDLSVLEVYTGVASSRPIPPDFFLYCGYYDYLSAEQDGV